MGTAQNRTLRRGAAGLCALLLAWTAAAAAPLRIVTYNIAADIGGYTTARPGLITVLEGIGNEATYAPARAVDVLTLQETTSNNTTVAPIVVELNNLYGGNVYAMGAYQALVNGNNPSSGNGPNAIIYRTSSLQLISETGVGLPSTQGAPRQPVRYQFRPVGGVANNDFYVYVSHDKAGNTQVDRDRRLVEAQLIRSDAATLSANARILYTGDFNMYTSSEPAYQELIAAGPGQSLDPLNRPGNWQDTSSFRDIMTYSATDLHARFDFILTTQNVTTDPTGLYYVPGSYHTFGVNGSTPLDGSVDLPGNTALPNLPNRSAVLTALTTASDHLPVVADFEIIVTGPALIALDGGPFGRTVYHGGLLSNDTFTVTNSGEESLNYTISASAAWLSASPESGVSTGEADVIEIVYDVSTLVPGTYNATLEATDPSAANSPQTIAVTLEVLVSFGDFDSDGDVDMSDFAHLQACYSDFPPTPICANADLTADDVVGQADLNQFLGCLRGAGLEPGC